MQKVYLYGLLGRNEHNKPFTSVEIDGKKEPVIGFWYKNIGFAISRAPTYSFDELPREELADWFIKHLTVMEVIHRNYPLVPVKLGTVISDMETVRQVLVQNECQFNQLLDSMAGKNEWDLNVSWCDLPKVLAAVSEEEEIKNYKEQLVATGKISQQDLIKVGEMISKALTRQKKDIGSEIVAELVPLLTEYYINEVIGDKLVLSLAMLVNPEQEEAVKTKLAALDNTVLQNYGIELDFQLLGPLPPKSFTTIELKKITGGQLETARKLLGLPACANLKQIKDAKKVHLRISHPDISILGANEMAQNEQVQKIVATTRMLEEYCRHYGYCSLPENPGDSYIFRIITPDKMHSQ
ncbi:hypothetical protein Ga0466249_005320 [Sporomusaceae bacterium BoRhaA]|nr:hypothetical protein [Pelorhabdus rhamnosifermentans]